MAGVFQVQFLQKPVFVNILFLYLQEKSWLKIEMSQEMQNISH